MPTSYYVQISTTIQIIQDINPKSVLDVGAGFGKYGVLCRKMLDFEKEAGGKVLSQVLAVCKNLIVCDTAIPCYQSYLANKLEEHKSI
jgi:hypothetical protein